MLLALRCMMWRGSWHVEDPESLTSAGVGSCFSTPASRTVAVATAKYEARKKIYRKIGPFMFGYKLKQMVNGPPQSTGVHSTRRRRGALLLSFWLTSQPIRLWNRLFFSFSSEGISYSLRITCIKCRIKFILNQIWQILIKFIENNNNIFNIKLYVHSA